MIEPTQDEKSEVIRMYGKMVSQWVPATGTSEIVKWLARALEIAKTIKPED